MRITVPLSNEVLNKLQLLARRERRHPRDQAAILIEVALTLAQGREKVVGEPRRPRSAEPNSIDQGRTRELPVAPSILAVK